MWNSALLFAAAATLVAQDGLQVNLPADSPIAVVNSGWGESRSIPRGGATMIDLRTSIKFKNNSRQRLRGISLQVTSQEVAAGGKASVSVPSLDIPPGQEFPVKIDLRLLHPYSSSGQTQVNVTLDGLLFEDLSFYGPNRLGSRRQLTAWEIEARRDRQHLKLILARQGEGALDRAMRDILARDNSRQRLDIRLARAAAALPNAQNIETAFLSQSDVPVDGIRAQAVSSGNQLQILELAFQNRDRREIRSIELGLMVRDHEGREFSAGSLPATLTMKPKDSATIQPGARLTLNRPQGLPLAVESVTGFVQQVEFSNGDVWVPSSSFREEARLARIIPGSVEEQRLADLYRRRGLHALIEELNRQ